MFGFSLGGARNQIESGFSFIDFPPPAPDLSAPTAPSLPAGRVGEGEAPCMRWAVVPLLAEMGAKRLSQQAPFLFLWRIAGKGAAVGSARRGWVAGNRKNVGGGKSKKTGGRK